MLAFAFSFTSFGVVLVLGGPQFATLEVAIYELTANCSGCRWPGPSPWSS